jgi:hypothetical protein
MKLFSAAVAAFVLLFAFAIPTMANAAGETADADISITPRSGSTFYNNAFKSANWIVETAIIPSGPFPEVPKIEPMKVADLGFPPSSAMTFNPKASMPVCPDDQLGPPPTSNSIPVPDMIARCPNALIGNGTAVFGLAQSTSPTATRAGEILIFNGGLVGGLPKIKVYAYSYDTSVGIYTSAILQPDGQLLFNIPQLTSDSSVRSLNLSIPGSKIVLEKPNFGLTVTLPAGQDPNYVQAKCVGNAGFPWTADFTMGSRDNGGNPIGDPEFVISDSGTAPCTGVPKAPSRPRLANLRVIGPGSARRNRPTVFRVQVRNTGTAAVTGARLVMAGRGVRVNAPVGRVAPRQTKTIVIRARFRLRGLSRTTIKLNTGNAGRKVARKNVRVR